MVSGSIWWPRGGWGRQRSPRGAHGAAQPQTPAGFCPWPCFQCLFSLPSLFSWPQSPLVLPRRLCNWDTFTHTVYPHRKAYCTLNKHFCFQMQTGYTVAYCNWFCVSVCAYGAVITDCPRIYTYSWLEPHSEAATVVLLHRCSCSSSQGGVRGREINSVTEAAVYLRCCRSLRLSVFLLLTHYIIHHTIDMLTIGSTASFTAVDSTCILYCTNEMWVIRCHLSSMYPIWLAGQKTGRETVHHAQRHCPSFGLSEVTACIHWPAQLFNQYPFSDQNRRIFILRQVVG